MRGVALTAGLLAVKGLRTLPVALLQTGSAAQVGAAKVHSAKRSHRQPASRPNMVSSLGGPRSCLGDAEQTQTWDSKGENRMKCWKLPNSKRHGPEGCSCVRGTNQLSKSA